MNHRPIKGVTIITSTIRPECKANLFANYARQKWRAKELIIILNKNSLPMADYLRLAKRYREVRVFRLPENKSLGECLNFGVSKAKYAYIAKFDDDDYYSPDYLPEAMHMFQNPKADLVGKTSIYFYFPHMKKLLQMNKSIRPFRRVSHIAGATIMFKKNVFSRVRFVRAAEGTDVRFLKACLKKGYRIFSTTPYNFTAIRKAKPQSHTWKISDKQLLAKRDSRILSVGNVKGFVGRTVSQLVKR